MTADSVRIALDLDEARVLLALVRRGRPRTVEELNLAAGLTAALTAAAQKEPSRVQ